MLEFVPAPYSQVHECQLLLLTTFFPNINKEKYYEIQNELILVLIQFEILKVRLFCKVFILHLNAQKIRYDNFVHENIWILL